MAEMNLQDLLTKDVADMTPEELNFIISYSAKLKAATKVAKDKGLIVKREKLDKSPEVQLLASAFAAVIEANKSVIDALFPVSEDKPAGAKGVNIATDAECGYYIQILNRKAFALDAKKRKEEKVLKEEVEKEEVVDAL